MTSCVRAPRLCDRLAAGEGLVAAGAALGLPTFSRSTAGSPPGKRGQNLSRRRDARKRVVSDPQDVIVSDQENSPGPGRIGVHGPAEFPPRSSESTPISSEYTPIFPEILPLGPEHRGIFPGRTGLCMRTVLAARRTA